MLPVDSVLGDGNTISDDVVNSNFCITNTSSCEISHGFPTSTSAGKKEHFTCKSIKVHGAQASNRGNKGLNCHIGPNTPLQIAEVFGPTSDGGSGEGLGDEGGEVNCSTKLVCKTCSGSEGVNLRLSRVGFLT